MVHISESGWPNLFKLVFEKNPLASDTDFRLDIRLLPVQINYNEEIFSELLDFFFLPHMDCLEVTWGVIYQGYKYSLQFGRFIRNCLTSRVMCDLNIDLQNPCIVIGQYGKYSSQGSNFILDCGRMQIESAMVQDQSSSMSSMSSDESPRKVYDEFLFTFSGIQALQLPARIEWNSLREEPSSEYHLVPKTKMQLTLSTSTLQTQELPAWKLDIFIKCAKLNLSDSKISAIIDFLRDLPLPSRNKNMKKNQAKTTLWRIDKNWVIPSIGKLELLYLENQLAEQENIEASAYETSMIRRIQKRTNALSNKQQENDDTSESSDATDFNIKDYCREIDLPGFEDNISPNNKMFAVVQVVIKDAGVIFDRASGTCDKSYLYLGARDINLDMGLLEHGPAIQLGVGSIKLMDRQVGVDLFNLAPGTGQEQVS